MSPEKKDTRIRKILAQKLRLRALPRPAFRGPPGPAQGSWHRRAARVLRAG